MAELKSKPTKTDVTEYVLQIEGDTRRRDASALIELMSRITGEPPTLWNGNIIGFGQYHYKYDSGHEGDSALAGFALRKNAVTIYLMGTQFPELMAERTRLLAKLGKHTTGQVCLYVKKLSDIDMTVLEALVRLSVDALRRAPTQR